LDLPCNPFRPAGVSGYGGLYALTLDGRTAGLVTEAAAGLGAMLYVIWAARYFAALDHQDLPLSEVAGLLLKAPAAALFLMVPSRC
jgi:hypothetical protein